MDRINVTRHRGGHGKETQRPLRLAVFAAHPVPYHVGIYRALDALPDVRTTVFYEDSAGLSSSYQAEFSTTLKWDVDLLGGYHHRFMTNWGKPGASPDVLARVNPQVIWHIKRGRFDAVLFAGYTRLTDWMVFIAAKWHKTPILFRGEATLTDPLSTGGWLATAKRLVLPNFFARCDIVFYSCTGNRRYYEHYDVPPEKLRLLPCAVDNSFFAGERERLAGARNQVRDELGFSEGDFVVAFAARITQRKRPLDLVEAVSRTGNERIVVLMIGDGPLRTEVEALAKAKKVNLVSTGFVNQGQISRYYATADAFAMLSEQDNSPKAVNEALNFRLPVICTTAAGTAFDLVVSGVNGFHVEVGDIDAIAGHLNALENDRDKARWMGEQSASIVQEWSFEADAAAIRDAMVATQHAR